MRAEGPGQPNHYPSLRLNCGVIRFVDSSIDLEASRGKRTCKRHPESTRMRFDAGQVDAESAAAPVGAGDVDSASPVGDDSLHQGQAEARALAGLLGGEEGLEDPRQRLRVHAPAPILDLQKHIGSRPERAVRKGARDGKVCLSQADAKAAVVADGVYGVGAKVHHDSVQLRRVTNHEKRRCWSSRFQLEVDAGSAAAAYKLKGLGNDLVELDRHANPALVAGSEEDPVHEVARATRTAQDVLREAARRRTLLWAFDTPFRPSH